MLSFFIIIGAGHGIACVGLLEIVGLLHKFDMGTEDFSLSLASSYNESISATALFAFLGHILLIISMLIKNNTLNSRIKFFGLLFLWVSFFYLTHNIFSDGLSQIGFVTGLPFFIVSIYFAYKLGVKKSQSS